MPQIKIPPRVNNAEYDLIKLFVCELFFSDTDVTRVANLAFSFTALTREF